MEPDLVWKLSKDALRLMVRERFCSESSVLVESRGPTREARREEEFEELKHLFGWNVKSEMGECHEKRTRKGKIMWTLLRILGLSNPSDHVTSPKLLESL